MRCEYCSRTAVGTIENKHVSGLALCLWHWNAHPDFVLFPGKEKANA